MAESSRKLVAGILKKGEVHKERFEDDSERWREAKGYIVVLLCNLLSCCSLAAYVVGRIDAAAELRWEAAFLVFKCAVEVRTGKFSFELLLHHSAMVLGFFANQHASMRCWVFITVHQQFVHVPFALRAAWRLTLPAMGYIGSETSWLRRGLAKVFWITWMFSCGYRTPLILGYSAFGAAAFKNFTWQPAVGVACALVLARLDLSWTRAMWPKQPDPNADHEAWFQFGVRAVFFAGLLCAALAVLADVGGSAPVPAPAPLALWSSLVSPGPFHGSVLRCLAAADLRHR